MKKIFGLLCLILVFSCSSDEDGGLSIDTSLLFGQWYEVGLCQEQNRLALNPNFAYESFSSGAVDCDDPVPDTYRFAGTYAIDGNRISYNQTEADLVIDGTALTVLDFPDPDIVREVTELTETSLVIRVYIDRGNNVIEELGESNYER